MSRLVPKTCSHRSFHQPYQQSSTNFCYNTTAYCTPPKPFHWTLSAWSRTLFPNGSCLVIANRIYAGFSSWTSSPICVSTSGWRWTPTVGNSGCSSISIFIMGCTNCGSKKIHYYHTHLSRLLHRTQRGTTTASLLLPIPDDLFTILNGGTYFAKLDLGVAHLQIPVAPESIDCLTTSNHRGLFQYTLLPFGI